ncbi:MAG: hypothetical protein JWO10_344 [Microbacteriaceae bacterium]|nr:hypothetical protein [Microbacteriaceae bacterium]
MLMSATEPNANEQYSDTNNRDIEQKQQNPVEASEAARDDDIDLGAVKVLPGTGGPDDVGDIEVPPEDYNRTGHVEGQTAS